MAPLVGYDSSDDDEEVQQQSSLDAGPSTEELSPQESLTETPEKTDTVEPCASTQVLVAAPQPLEPGSGKASPDTTAIGPTLPPTGGTDAYPEEMDQDALTPQAAQTAPASPYSANRSVIHTLTLPTVPNMDIPPSPPGSPSTLEPHAALTAKFDKFLELKRKKGTHFNARIADLHALKNPPLVDKLLGFVGVGVSFEDESVAGVEQYATTLPTDMWDPAAFPDWAYRGQLRKAQEKVQKERGRERGDAVHFVPAGS